jgi:hypothetical protein
VKWTIVVIDDSCRFPLHVWRYVSRSLGFGIGEVEREGMRRLAGSPAEIWISEDKPLTTSDGIVSLWWVDAGDSWEERIGMIAGQFRESRLMFLVDVHGKRNSSYNVEKVCDYLKRQPMEPRWYPVSAYYSGNKISGRDVLPKTRETLDMIRGEIYPVEPDGFLKATDVHHVLVTGAGFEVGADGGGFGLPATKTLLEAMGDPFCYSDSQDGGLISLKCGNGFPWPVGSIWDLGSFKKAIKEAASHEALDAYWDVLLQGELRREIDYELESSSDNDPSLGEETREDQKLRALFRETRMREAFRRSMLDHDWGYIGQSIIAARLGWRAWLTTNYTQFSDRAIALARKEESQLGGWRIVSSAAEARITTREEPWASPRQPKRYLFKLHGDIGHLHTMAIAGHDKDTFSPLSVPMEDIYQIYASAYRFLADALDELVSNDSLVMWHIVGHGLQDKRLSDLIGRISRHEKPTHFFVVVNPNPDKPRQRLQSALKWPHQIESLPLRAAEYMARIAQAGLPSRAEAQERMDKV